MNSSVIFAVCCCEDGAGSCTDSCTSSSSTSLPAKVTSTIAVTFQLKADALWTITGTPTWDFDQCVDFGWEVTPGAASYAHEWVLECVSGTTCYIVQESISDGWVNFTVDLEHLTGGDGYWCYRMNNDASVGTIVSAECSSECEIEYAFTWCGSFNATADKPTPNPYRNGSIWPDLETDIVIGSNEVGFAVRIAVGAIISREPDCGLAEETCVVATDGGSTYPDRGFLELYYKAAITSGVMGTFSLIAARGPYRKMSALDCDVSPLDCQGGSPDAIIVGDDVEFVEWHTGSSLPALLSFTASSFTISTA